MMKLFYIESAIHQSFPVFALTTDDAAGLYIDWEIANGVASQSFTVARQTIGSLPPAEGQQLREALQAGIAGYGTYHPAWGWSIDEAPSDP